MSLYNTYRPSSLTEMVGDYSWVESYLKKPDHNRSILIHSTGAGYGKTTLARIIATMVGNELTTYEYNFGDTRGIDTVREITDMACAGSLTGSSIFIIDEVQKATQDAKDAMLKLLEDVPQGVYFLLCTSEIEKIDKFMRSRCFKIEMPPLTEDQIFDRLEVIAEKEGFTIKASVIDKIAANSNGSLRDAISHLEAIASLPVEEIKHYRFISGDEEGAMLHEFVSELLGKCRWEKLAKALTDFEKVAKIDAEAVRRYVLKAVQGSLATSYNKRGVDVMEGFITPTFDSGYSRLWVAIGKVYKEE